MLSNSDGCFRVPLAKIMYCTSYNSSTVFHTIGDHKPIVIAKPIIYYENLLLPYGFVRIHYSTLLNIDYMCHTSKGEDINELTLTTGEKLIISRPRRTAVMLELKRRSVEQPDSSKKQVKGENKQKSRITGTVKRR
ncbi:MAG TPA: LytTR family DNA-binding domain-containing protein [Chitinophagales bacterium]|nr:LytTR family DNA-binding domain-containing protein [Chitinophagales bacterium]